MQTCTNAKPGPSQHYSRSMYRGIEGTVDAKNTDPALSPPILVGIFSTLQRYRVQGYMYRCRLYCNVQYRSIYTMVVGVDRSREWTRVQLYTYTQAVNPYKVLFSIIEDFFLRPAVKKAIILLL